MGTDDGVLIFDESGFIKKGDDSIGVGKQYCGSIGKVDNCQVGVFAAYASPYVRGDLKLYFIRRFENVVLIVCIFFPKLYFLL
jgi:SRSO17 transposase